MPVTRVRSILLLSCCTLVLRCGGGPSTPSPMADATITISAAGIVPTEVRIPVGGKVLFTNNDARPHAMASDPLTLHTDCPPINDVGTLEPGQSRTTGALTVPRVCGFHDHLNETSSTWRGQIIIQ